MTNTWVNAHGRLWYDDPWYRVAWIAWPQFIGLMVFLLLWAHHSAPWGKPAEQAEVSAGCSTGNDYNSRVSACSAQITSGKLKGDQLARGYHMRGWAYYMLKQPQAAMQDYNQAISISPTDADILLDRGVLLAEQNDYESALRDYNQAISLKPDYALAYADQGYLYRRMNRPGDALTALSTAIKLNPNLALAYLGRASVYGEKSDWRAMYEDANKLIELSPNDRMGYDFRGKYYFEVGQYEPAISDFTKSISLNSNSIFAYRTRGRAHFLLNQFDKATEDFDAALGIDAKDPTLLAWIADLKRRTASAPASTLDKPAEQADVSAACSTGNDYNQRVTACSAQIASGRLKGDRLGLAYYSRGWAHYELKQLQPATEDLIRLFRYLRLPSTSMTAAFF
jgi:tetratricopeptide (TPR) repeat protein